MPTVIAFSAQGDDYILVEGDPQETNDALAVSNRAGSGLVQLTQIPGTRQKFDPGPVFVNPERVAYMRPPAS